jgi:hypothetical protein
LKLLWHRHTDDLAAVDVREIAKSAFAQFCMALQITPPPWKTANFGAIPFSWLCVVLRKSDR